MVVAAALAWWTGTPALAAAIVAVILLNAGFAFAQELQAERAVAALAAYLPARAKVLYAAQGLRTLAIAQRPLDASAVASPSRAEVERGLCLQGLVAMFDPPRPQVLAATTQSPPRRNTRARGQR